MIYLIGGAPRAGKTRLAQLLLERRGATFVPTDALAMALGEAAPELGISLATEAADRSVRSQGLVEALTSSLRCVVREGTIEGELLRPEHVASLVARHADIRASFLVRPRLTVADLADERGTWVAETPADALPGLRDMLVATSLDLQARCGEVGVTVFEGPSAEALETALAWLTRP